MFMLEVTSDSNFCTGFQNFMYIAYNFDRPTLIVSVSGPQQTMVARSKVIINHSREIATTFN